jgi:hypothetical protein
MRSGRALLRSERSNLMRDKRGRKQKSGGGKPSDCNANQTRGLALKENG